jgi:homoserine kinase type II
LTGRTPEEQRLIGETLGRTHAALDGVQIDGADRFHWVDPAAGHLRIRPWLRPAVAGAIAAYEQVGELSWGLLHADPSPDAFRYDDTCGLIDWATALYGPWLYDVASTVMYLGGPPASATFLDGYLRTGPLDADEVERGLVTMLRFRFAVQADYFARRLVRADLTGIDSAAGNEQGLEDARRGLRRPSKVDILQ